MYRIYCDETWKDVDAKGVVTPYYLFHGVLVKTDHADSILAATREFRNRRGLTGTEIKWEKVHKEYKDFLKSGRTNRYSEYLRCCFFPFLRTKQISFGSMFIEKEQYDRVETRFSYERGAHVLEFFFMMYYQFLTHCFIRTQVHNSPVEIYIDNRTVVLGKTEYDFDVFRRILNRKQALVQRWDSQIDLNDDWLIKYREAVRFVGLEDSQSSEFIQMADLVAGCFRYILENNWPSPKDREQNLLFDEAPKIEIKDGHDYLADYFYTALIGIEGYRDLNLCAGTRNYRFNIFPFKFRQRY